MKMYQLLRDNVRSGPYTVECLTQMNLKTFDLIWVDNESIMWKYPSEVAELRQYAPKAVITEGTRVNTLKEKQIHYFRDCFGESNDQNNMMSVQTALPDAFASDIPVGYEYLVAAENRNRYGGNMFISTEAEHAIIDNEMMDLVNGDSNTFSVLGEKQYVDTMETTADHQQFTSVLPISEYARKNRKVNVKASTNKNVLSTLTGLWLVASVLSYLKL
jgi:hypothetical protein